MTKPSDTLARLRARSTEAGRFVLPLEPTWADKLIEAYGALRRAEVLDDEDRATRVAEARAAISELEESATDNVIVWRFRRLSRPQYDALVNRCPPSQEQKDKEVDLPLRERNVFDLNDMRWALLAEVCIDPRYTPEEAKELIEGEGEDGAPFLSRGEAEALVNAAMASALSTPRALPRELTLP